METKEKLEKFGDGPWFFLRFCKDSPIRLEIGAFRPPPSFQDKWWPTRSFQSGDWNKNTRLKAFCILMLLASAKAREQKDDVKLQIDEAPTSQDTWLKAAYSLRHDSVDWWQKLVFRYGKNADESADEQNASAECVNVYYARFRLLLSF